MHALTHPVRMIGRPRKCSGQKIADREGPTTGGNKTAAHRKLYPADPTLGPISHHWASNWGAAAIESRKTIQA